VAVQLLPLKVSSRSQQGIHRRRGAEPVGKGDAYSQVLSCMSKEGESCDGSLSLRKDMRIGRVEESGALQDFKEDAEIARRWAS